MMTSNGTHHQYNVLPRGVYVPIVTPFLSSNEGEVDIPTLQKHVGRLAAAGCGVVLQGTNGEASHLSREERIAIIKAVRSSVSATTPIIAGTGAGSLNETILLTKDAAAAGADAVLVIAPGYFAGAIAKDRQALSDFFTEVANASPVPVMIYNFPASAAGIDLDSDLLCQLAQHPNVIGAKLTCSQVGKGLRLAEILRAQTSTKPVFHVFPGFADILVPSMVAGMTGVIAGTGNLFPHTLVELYNLTAAAFAESDFAKLQAAQKLQEHISQADWIMAKAGIGGSKWGLSRWHYDMGKPRRPLQPASKEVQQMMEQGLQKALAHENELAKAKGDAYIAKV